MDGQYERAAKSLFRLVKHKTLIPEQNTGPGCAPAELYLRRYWSELVVAVQVELSAVGVAAEVQRLIPVDGKAENAQEEHPH